MFGQFNNSRQGKGTKIGLVTNCMSKTDNICPNERKIIRALRFILPKCVVFWYFADSRKMLSLQGFLALSNKNLIYQYNSNIQMLEKLKSDVRHSF